MAIAYVQSTYNSKVVNSTSIVTTTSLNVSAGNLLVVCVNTYDSVGDNVLNSVTDTAGNTYVKAVGVFRSGTSAHRSEIWYAKNITAESSNIITGSYSGEVSYGNISVTEFSGVDTTSPLVSTSYTQEASGVTSHSSGNITTTSSDTVIIGGGAGNDKVNFTVGTGFTALEGTYSYYFSLYKILSASGSYDVNYTSDSTTTKVVTGAIFKGVASTGWSNDLNGVSNTNISKVNGISLSSISKVNGVS